MKRVRVRVDGGSGLNDEVMWECQLFWGWKWEAVFEESIRVSIYGGGSDLDCSFVRLRGRLKSVVRKGSYYHDADSTSTAIMKDAPPPTKPWW